MTRKRTAILISGRGSNMQALLAAARDPAYPAEIAVVISNRPDAPGLDIARAAGVPAVAIDHKQFATRTAFEAKLHTALRDAGTELICNAGFMRLLTGGFVDRWLDRHLNIHPSLLPAFPGLDTHARVLRDGVRITGCTVHFIRVEMDSGPIVAQAAVQVLPGDSEDALAARVLAAEHKLYPHALALVASGAVRVVEGTAVHQGTFNQSPPLFSPGLSETV